MGVLGPRTVSPLQIWVHSGLACRVRLHFKFQQLKRRWTDSFIHIYNSVEIKLFSRVKQPLQVKHSKLNFHIAPCKIFSSDTSHIQVIERSEISLVYSCPICPYTRLFGNVTLQCFFFSLVAIDVQDFASPILCLSPRIASISLIPGGPHKSGNGLYTGTTGIRCQRDHNGISASSNCVSHSTIGKWSQSGSESTEETNLWVDKSLLFHIFGVTIIFASLQFNPFFSRGLDFLNLETSDQK